MNMFCRALLVLLVVFASAQSRADSFYWDPAFGGEGWSIDRQNDVVFLAYYTYDASNQPTFLTAAGTLAHSVLRGEQADADVNVGTFTAPLIRSRRGLPPETVGTLVFRQEQGDGVDRILVSFNGQSRQLVPFYYNYATRGHALLGLWAFSFIDADLGLGGFLALFEEDDILLLDTGGLVFGTDPASGREILTVFTHGEEYLGGIVETDDPAVDLEFLVLHGIKDSRPMRGLWVTSNPGTGELLSDILPFTASKYRSLGELDDVGLYAAKRLPAVRDSGFRARALARVVERGPRAFLDRLRQASR